MRCQSALVLGAALLASACGGASQPTPVGTPAATIDVSAANLAFEPVELDIPANSTFAIFFTNNDNVPHDISIRGSNETRTGEVFTGPGQRTYVFAGLPAGAYQFLCEVHPQMTGSVVVS